jgi:hypothetical protein
MPELNFINFDNKSFDGSNNENKMRHDDDHCREIVLA